MENLLSVFHLLQTRIDSLEKPKSLDEAKSPLHNNLRKLRVNFSFSIRVFVLPPKEKPRFSMKNGVLKCPESYSFL